jgi:hypothetical protein
MPTRRSPVSRSVRAGGLGDHPRHDAGHAAPGHPKQRRHRGGRTPHGQPRARVLERSGEPGCVPRPRHRRHGRAVLDTRHPRAVRLDHPDRGEVQVPPPSPPRSYHRAGRRHRPQRGSSPRRGRTATTRRSPSSVSSVRAASMTAPRSPSSRCHILALRTPFPDLQFLSFDNPET